MSTPEGLLEFMLDVVCFLEQQLIYDHIGRFPGPQWRHQRAGYAEYLVERTERLTDSPRALWAAVTAGAERNAPCPCGAPRKTKACHFDEIGALRTAAHRVGLLSSSFDELHELAHGR